ncbi:(Fe-S)-binding protein [Marinobacter nanhaiticus D15-8W]|uniref:(Fe-S)-binding protein n=1 Tax=Marinobacter nanhaiticus TaxID=1305740 RepID=UPI0002CC73DD|nr:(Fe-S)-binding protein [Marinobacter nanhaiticus]BES72978.1 (Fe-S)-binding protein [Marinobacter nanhaiticus D15-8W]
MNTAEIKRVYLFGTCLVDVFHPRAGMAAVRLLEREGLFVDFPPEQTCCGQPPYNSGYDEQARDVARQVVERFSDPIPVIVPSGSCAGMLRHHYPSLLADDPLADAARGLATRTYELHEFLNRVLKIRLEDKGEPTKIVMHTSCSARREMGIREDGLALLGQLKNVEVCEPENAEACCGFGGTFAVKMSDISAAMAADKCEAIEATGADQLLSSDCGCLMNIDGMLRKQARDLDAEHLAEFLWQRTGGDAL